ncbi:MAG: septum formation initiator family protein [Mariprofundaceae bacterium]|nr:septum formation initiator family protein [Mariprofundaceae bacterium]
MFNRLLHLAFFLFAIVIIQYLVYEVTFSDQGYLAYQEEQKQLKILQKDVEILQQQHDQLAKEIIYIRESPYALEALIHSELGYVYPNEYVLIMPEPNKEKIIRP